MGLAKQGTIATHTTSADGALLRPWENITVMNSRVTFRNVKTFVQLGKCHDAFSFQGIVWAMLHKLMFAQRREMLEKEPSLCLQKTEATTDF